MRSAAKLLLPVAFVFVVGAWHIAANCQSPITYVMVGQKAIAVRVPQGFIDPRIVRPDTAAAVNARTAQGNRNLSFLIPIDDLKRIEAGSEPRLERVLKMEVLREQEHTNFSGAEFKRISAAFRNSVPPRGVESLGIYDETPYSISRLSVGNGTITAASLLHAQGRIVYVIVEAREKDGDNIGWARESSKSFIRLVLEANRQPVSAR